MTSPKRPAPRVPAGPKSLAALAKKLKNSTALRRFVQAVEPWYDWNITNTWRMNAQSFEEACASEFDVRRVELQWLGFHIGIVFGRMPKAVRS